MSRLHIILIGTACFALGLGVQALYDIDDVALFLRANMGRVVLIALISLLVLAALLATAYVWALRVARTRLGVSADMVAPDIVSGLWDSLISTDGVTNPTPQDQRRAAFVNLGAWLLRRQARVFYYTVTVATLGGLIGSATLFLLYEQNRKLDIQNRQITLQTDAAIVQSVMLEAARRTTLAVVNQQLFREIAEAPLSTDQTCPTDGNRSGCWDTLNGQRLFHLPEALVSRIRTFADRSTQYHIAQPKPTLQSLSFDTSLRSQYSFVLRSPERGQLIEAFYNAGVFIPPLTLNQAMLADANLSGIILQQQDINVVDFERANLADADLTGSRLQEATLIGATLRNANLTDADAQGAFFRTLSFNNTQVSGANFTGANWDIITGGTAWAWSDNPPRNLSDWIDLSLCTFDGERHDRRVKPTDC